MKTKKLFYILLVAMTALFGFSSCNKDEDATKKTGVITFSGTYWDKPGADYSYTVTIDGKTQTFDEGSPAPSCGTISAETACFTLPVGTYTFTFIRHRNNDNGTIEDSLYPVTNSVTISEGGCLSIRWD